jgi:hypothetical protein
MKRRKVVKYKKRITLCLDYVCKVLLFVEDQKIFLNCLLLNKSVNYHLNNEGSYCGRNVKFYFRENPKNIKKYVYNLYNHGGYFDIKHFKNVFDIYPNLKELSLYRNENITDEGLKYLKGIGELDLDENQNTKLKYLKGIQQLNLSCNENITDKGLKYLQGIQKLNLYNSKKRITLCLDCICEILLFTKDQKTFLNCLLLNKNINYYLNNGGSYCGKNVEFYFERRSKNIKKYVYRLYDPEINFDIEDFKNVFVIYPNLQKLKYLKGIKKLDLNSNENITDEGLKHLKGIKELYLYHNENITDEGLKYLKGIKELDLCCNTNITDEGLKYLQGIKELNLNCNKNVTDEGLKYLKGIKVLHLGRNEKITDEGLKYLKGIKRLNISRNKNITNEGLKYLKGIKELYLLKNENVTEGLKYLNLIKKK